MVSLPSQLTYFPRVDTPSGGSPAAFSDIPSGKSGSNESDGDFGLSGDSEIADDEFDVHEDVSFEVDDDGFQGGIDFVEPRAFSFDFAASPADQV